MAVADGPGAHRSENNAVTILRIRMPFLRTYGGKGRISEGYWGQANCELLVRRINCLSLTRPLTRPILMRRKYVTDVF